MENYDTQPQQSNTNESNTPHDSHEKAGLILGASLFVVGVLAGVVGGYFISDDSADEIEPVAQTLQVPQTATLISECTTGLGHWARCAVCRA